MCNVWVSDKKQDISKNGLNLPYKLINVLLQWCNMSVARDVNLAQHTRQDISHN